MKIFTILLLFVSIIVGGLGCALRRPVAPVPHNAGVACTADAMLCPDGSAVGRVGPHCEFAPCPAVAPSSATPVTDQSSVSLSGGQEQWQRIVLSRITGVSTAFDFTFSIPATWAVEAVSAVEAVNIYDPQASGSTNLAKSQIFIRYFKASSFLTLSTVTIHTRTETTINERPAVVYDIEKKSGVANFANQPLWRNERHIVTDIRATDANPTTFYVFAQKPGLDTEVYNQFLRSVTLAAVDAGAPVLPVADLHARLTKKVFGTRVTPEQSPVQPERFSGYHTAIDVEYGDVTGDVPVQAMLVGTVVRSGRVSGYGGMIAIQHHLNGQTVVAIYGHLDPARLVPNGRVVAAGETIGYLGRGFTSETDGERRHLHFGIHRGSAINILGYVQSESELTDWIDPLVILESR